MRHPESYSTSRLARALGVLLALIATARVAPLRAQAPRPVSKEVAAADVPSVALDYSFLLDGACAQRARSPLDSALVAHVIATVPAYRVHEIAATEGAEAFVRELRVRSTSTASAPSAVGAR